ncbi:UTP-glucose-1-phosphate uridylyltransferase [Spiromyces aspiralis]|uniref:UTP-glucose-1-phosphate uridylyltransferase n=1 Tax=Spiromyces aspiralis TaxID=68401 RepID=A0ACC1HK89_9FUNG|nr:UTP-glucose-1-phosphate uridylyltransferase [Spiromyces aspiralis]
MASHRPSFTRHHSQDGRNPQAEGGVAGAVRASLNELVAQAPDWEAEKANKEMDDFLRLFKRYLNERSERRVLDWNKVRSPKPEDVLIYQSMPKKELAEVAPLLDKLAVLKLNGGLGTTMGCVGPKSAIEVRDGQTFLDLTVQQIEHLNTVANTDVPLILMNSFNTDEDTSKIVQKYNAHNVSILTFNQSRYPRIKADSLLPLPRSYENVPGTWYPPGHGDLYESFANSGLLDQLLAEGKEWVFVSNVDNLGATVDPVILNHLAESGAEFIMEVTDKTKADIKGGTLIDYDGQVRLLEIAQVPKAHVDDFKRVKKFKIFNTNNLWISLKAMKRLVEARELNLDLIVNNKTTDDGTPVIQLETAVGAAIKHFKGAHGINVPRFRFLPVKSTSDLFLVTSDLYTLENGQLRMNPKRTFQTVPIVKLGDHFKKVNDYLARFKTPPQILELDHLTVTGDVVFGADVELKGTVIIVANHGAHIDIPRGAILNDKVVSGNLYILDH